MTTINTQEQWDNYTPIPGDRITFNLPAGVITVTSFNPLKDVRLNFKANEVAISGRAEGTARDGTTLRLRGDARGTAEGRATIVARDSSTATAAGESTAYVFDKSTTYAFGCATVSANGRASVFARGKVQVRAGQNAVCKLTEQARGHIVGSACASGGGQACIYVYGASARAIVNDKCTCATFNATVTAYDSAYVEAYGQSVVHLSDYSSARIGGTSVAFVNDVATATADSTSIIFAGSRQAHHDGKNIFYQEEEPRSVGEWLKFHRVAIKGGRAVLYKAVPDDFVTGLERGKPTTWVVGQDVTCDDWNPEPRCGGGLHLCPTPGAAFSYQADATHFLECEVDLDSIIPLPESGSPKCKAPKVTVAREVDLRGRDLKEER